MKNDSQNSDNKAKIRKNAVLRVNGEEIAALLKDLSIKPSRYSPYAEILKKKGLFQPRKPENILAMPHLFYSDLEILEYLTAAAQPDRVITAVTTDYKKKFRPVPYKFFQSQKTVSDFTAIHHKNEHESEILFPYNPDEIITWLFLSMHYSVKNPFGVVEIDELDFNEVITVLGLLDCYKHNLASSLAERTENPGFVFTVEQIKNAITNSIDSRDRRWLLTSMKTFLEIPENRTGLNSGNLVVRDLNEKELNEALNKLEEKDIISLPGSEELSQYVFNPALQIMATSLFQWDSFAALYDTQVLNHNSSGTEYGENLLAFFASASVNWVIMTNNLSTDLSNTGSFKIKGQSAYDLIKTLQIFFKTTDRPIENDFYAPDESFIKIIKQSTSIPEEKHIEADLSKEKTNKQKYPKNGAEKPDVIFCTNCGQKLEADCKFCDNCGEKT